MDDSGLSFFDNPDFEFANEAQTGSALNNKMYLILFADKVLEDSELSGFVSINIHSSLKEGSFFLRIETLEELNLMTTPGNEKIDDKIKILVEQLKETESTKSERSKSAKKSNMIVPTPINPTNSGLSTARPFREEKFMLKGSDDVPKENYKTIVNRMYCDFQAFALDYEVAKPTILSIPFRFKLTTTPVANPGSTGVLTSGALTSKPSSGLLAQPSTQTTQMTQQLTTSPTITGNVTIKRPLERSCDLKIDRMIYMPNKKKAAARVQKVYSDPQKKELGKDKILDKDRELLLEQPAGEYIKLSHRIICYFIPKTDLHSFNSMNKTSEHERSKIRYEYCMKLESPLWEVKEFSVIPNLKLMNNRKFKHVGDAVIKQDNPLFLCCSTTTKFKIGIGLDLVNLREQDSSLNFVMTFNSKVIDQLLWLDVVLYSSLTLYSTENPANKDVTSTSVNVCFVDSFDLEPKLPKELLKDKILECIQKIDLSPIVGKYQSIDTPQTKMEFFIRFYLSNLKHKMTQLIATIPIYFWRIDADLKIPTPESTSWKFDLLKKTLDEEKYAGQGVMLPSVLLDLESPFNLNSLEQAPDVPDIPDNGED